MKQTTMQRRSHHRCWTVGNITPELFQQVQSQKNKTAANSDAGLGTRRSWTIYRESISPALDRLETAAREIADIATTLDSLRLD